MERVRCWLLWFWINRRMRSDANATFHPIERNALSAFYNSTNGTGWTNRTLWLDEYASYCRWTGVTCDGNGHVTQLKLTKNGLTGRLSESIGNLTFIERLDLSDNDIKGSIPTEIGLLSKLTHLGLSSNSFNGSISEDLGRFLKIMNLAGNELTGSIPEDLGRFQSLKILNLAGNKLAGTIPPTIGDMTVLEVLNLSSNSLSGPIPFQIGQLEGTLNRLDLANNTFSGTIPSQLGQLQGASILLKDNLFDNKTATLSLCMVHRIGGVEAFDLAYDMTFCPIERNALSDFYDAAKGAEWTDRTNWLDGDEYASYCDWKGVTCEKNRVTKLNLSNNGLSGRLSESIVNLTSIEVMDLSDNDMKGSIPSEIGRLSNLTYLRLSYNAFSGAVPKSLGYLNRLKLLHLQSNRINKMPNIPQLDESIYYESTFVTDCGASAFDVANDCGSCTMCCNADDYCYPQGGSTQDSNLDQNYGKDVVVLFSCFIVFCCMVVLFLYLSDKRKNRANALRMEADNESESRLEEDDKYALSRIGKDSVYSYFVTDKRVGWLAALATLATQVWILTFFIQSASNSTDTLLLQFTWKCPPDSDTCKEGDGLTKTGWFVFSVLTTAFLAKDMISGSKLIYHSSKVRHPLRSRIRYFFGGLCLCSVTIFIFYVSAVYNQIVSKNNADLIVNSVIILFVMEMDERVFSALAASNEKWTAHAANSESNSDFEAVKGGVIEEMKEKIESQEKELVILRSQQREITLRMEEMKKQTEEIAMLWEAMHKMQESQASESIPQCAAKESITTLAAESKDSRSDTDAEWTTTRWLCQSQR